MSAAIYDNALLEKLNSWMPKQTNLKIYGTNDARQLFETMADESNDQPIQLPILVLRRQGGYRIVNVNKRPMTYDGMTLEADEEKSIQLNAIPIELSYTISVYTRYYNEADMLIRNLIFNIINHPSFNVEISGTSTYHTANMVLDPNVDDDSDVTERFIVGNFTRLSLKVSISDAYLWDVRERDNLSITADLQFTDNIQNSTN